MNGFKFYKLFDFLVTLARDLTTVREYIETNFWEIFIILFTFWDDRMSEQCGAYLLIRLRSTQSIYLLIVSQNAKKNVLLDIKNL